MGDHMTALLADAGLEKANHTVSVIGARPTDTQTSMVELRSKIASLALVVAIDPDHESELIKARAWLGRRAGALAAPHMPRLESKMLVQPPNLDLELKLVAANSGGPAV